MKTPVTLLFFNRPDTLKYVFEKVQQARPPKLYLVQDGPRASHPTDMENVLACRAIVEQIDWECEVHKSYSEVNLGCGKCLSSGISWVFSQEERAILLEDDCVPDLSFFDFCDEMLERYKDDERISYISGLNHFEEWNFGGSSYGFTKGGAIWGWATWRRAWQLYDYTIEGIGNPYIAELIKDALYGDVKRIEHWKQTHERLVRGERLSYWATQWGYVKYAFHQLVIVPKYNLISNIGVGADSVHCKGSITKHERYYDYNFMPTKALEWPLVHPRHMLCDTQYDKMISLCSNRVRRRAIVNAIMNRIFRKKK